MLNGKLCAILAVASVLSAPAMAGPSAGILEPLIVAGNPGDVDGPGTGDSPAQRVDPNIPTSPYSGVVSLNIRYGGQSLICSGALIDATHVLTAGHCIDTNGQGTAIDVSQSFATSGRDVRAVFNATGSGAGAGIITASSVSMHPDYKGFGICPAGFDTFCVNDDVAIIELSQPAPISAQIYAISRDAQAEGTSFTMVGYGTTGSGVAGYTAGSANFRIKRSGTNNYDLYDGNDETYTTDGGGNQFFGNDAAEVWYADFDGNGGPNDKDLFCVEFNVCSGDLGNQSEATLGGGDSGGPSFVKDANGKLYLVANNTFSGRWLAADVGGTFGTYGGGILTSSYLDWIYANSDAENVPEPAMLGLFGLGAIGIVAARRRRKAA